MYLRGPAKRLSGHVLRQPVTDKLSWTEKYTNGEWQFVVTLEMVRLDGKFFWLEMSAEESIGLCNRLDEFRKRRAVLLGTSVDVA